jgi:UDP:flavonoid glycosyltransferase YjiC (YdhE family)
MTSAPLTPALAPEVSRPLKIVIFPLGYGLAHVGRCIEIAKVLRARGHDVVFAGDDPDHPRSKLDQVVSHEFRTVRCIEPAQHYAWDRFHDHGILITLWDVLHSQKWAPVDDILEDIVRVCQEEEPDLILGDASVGVAPAGHILGIPAAGVINAYNTHFVRPWSIFNLLIHGMEWMHFGRIRRRVYRKMGVKPINGIRLLQEMPLISPDLGVFHKSHASFPLWQSVGPILYEPPCEMPDWFDELKDGTTNIYITMGSTGLLEPLLRRCYAELGKSPYRFVVTTAGQVSEEGMAAAPDNFLFATYAPGLAIMEHCAAVVFHGGNGSMYQALAAGKPMLALPGHLEQQLCTEYMVEHKFGIKAAPRRLNGAQMLAAIETLIRDKSYTENARRFQADVCRGEAVERAAGILEAHARS